MLTRDDLESMSDSYRSDLLKQIEHNSCDRGGCRIWKGGVNSSGYPTKRLPGGGDDGPTESVHRLVYMLAGTIPDFQVSHLCHRKLCIKLEHLIDDTPSQNSERNTCKNSEDRTCTGHGDRPRCIVSMHCSFPDQVVCIVEVEVLICSYVKG